LITYGNLAYDIEGIDISIFNLKKPSTSKELPISTFDIKRAFDIEDGKDPDDILLLLP
jgi:hypothetical protein